MVCKNCEKLKKENAKLRREAIFTSWVDCQAKYREIYEMLEERIRNDVDAALGGAFFQTRREIEKKVLKEHPMLEKHEQKILDVVKELRQKSRTALLTKVKHRCLKEMTKKDFEKSFEKLKRRGFLYEPRKGFVQEL